MKPTPVWAWIGRITEAGTVLGSLCIAAMAVCYTAEVVARYVFNAPLNWSGDVSSYLLLVCLFCVLPKVTMEAGHVAVAFVQERLPAGWRTRYERTISRLTGIFCLISAGFVAAECLRQFREHVLTSQATQTPKWWLTAIATAGLLLAAIHFLAPGRAQPSTDKTHAP